MKLFTTLNIIRKHSPCEDSWKKALSLLGKTKADDDLLSFEWILENLGLDDALWGLRAVSVKDELERDRLARLFGCDCAERVLVIWYKHCPEDHRPKDAICVARKFANGEADESARSAAESAAWSAARSAADSAAWSAADSAAESAAWSAARSAADSAAWSAADSAARSAAESAAWSAAWSAARSAARSAADSAAWSAEQEEQIRFFKKYFCAQEVTE